MRTTIIYAPHPDDETLYLGSYITICKARGDRLILVAATDGGSSGAKAAGWTPSELCGIRRWEQQSAWRNLTGKSTDIIRIGSIDSQDPNLDDKITAKARELQAKYEVDSDVEHYAACNNGQSQGVDHDSVANGLRAATDLPVRRYANRCTSTAGTIYTPADMNAMQLADTCFEAFGHRSVPTFWDDLRSLGYRNRVVP